MAKWRQTTSKPPLGARIDWSNPITKGLVGCWLFNEFGGYPYEIADGLQNDVWEKSDPNCSWEKGGFRVPSSGLFDPGWFYPDLGEMSWVTSFVKHSGNGVAPIVGHRNSSVPGHTVFWKLRDGLLEWYYDSQYGIGAPNFDAGILWKVGATRDKTTRLSFYRDGDLYSSRATTPDLPSYALYFCGGGPGGVEVWQEATFYYFYFWSRCLSQDEIKLLHYEPYSFFEVPSLYIPVSWQAQSSQQTGKHRVLFSSKWKQTTQKPPLGAKIDWSNPITKDLVGCWLFNECGGGKVFDLAKGRNAELVNGTKFSNDALFFDNTDDYVRLPSQEYISPSKKWTAIVGINPFSINTNSSWGDWIWHPRGHYDYSLIVGRNSSTLKFLSYNSGNEEVLDAGVSPSIGRYNTLVIKHTNNNYYIGLNGSFVANKSLQAPAVTTDYNVLGGQPTVTSLSRWFDGLMYYAFFFSRPLTDDEIKHLHYEPYSFFEVPSMRTVVAFSGGGSAIAYPDTAQISITANDPTASAGSVATPDTAIVTVTAYNPTATAGSTATPEPAVIDVVAYNPTAMAGGAVTPEPAVVNITAYNPIASVGAEVSVDVAIISVVAYDPYATGGLTFDPTFYVYDKDGNGIENVFVELYAQPSNTLVTSGYTDATGKVSFTGVSAGTYLMRFSKAGYMRYEVTAYIEDGDDFKYRLYRSNYLYIGPFGAHVNLGPDDPTNIILG